MFAACLVIIAAAIGQALAAHALGSAWWVPQLVLVAFIRQASRQPRAWLPLAALSGACLIALTVRWAAPVLLLFVAFGAAWSAAMRFWDVADSRLQAIATGIAAAVLISVTAGFDGAWSWPMAGLTAWQAVLSAAASAVWAAVRPVEARMPGAVR